MGAWMLEIIINGDIFNSFQLYIAIQNSVSLLTYGLSAAPISCSSFRGLSEMKCVKYIWSTNCDSRLQWAFAYVGAVADVLVSLIVS